MGRSQLECQRQCSTLMAAFAVENMQIQQFAAKDWLTGALWAAAMTAAPGMRGGGTLFACDGPAGVERNRTRRECLTWSVPSRRPAGTAA